MRGNNVMLGYHDDPEAHRAGVPRRLVPLRRPRRVASRRHDRAARPRQGRDHLGRREHLDDRGRAGARVASRGARVRRRRDPARALGRAAEGVRDAARGRRGDGRGADRALPRRASRASRRPTRSSSARCRRPRPARCRSSCCAIASGATARRASTDVVTCRAAAIAALVAAARDRLPRHGGGDGDDAARSARDRVGARIRPAVPGRPARRPSRQRRRERVPVRAPVAVEGARCSSTSAGCSERAGGSAASTSAPPASPTGSSVAARARRSRRASPIAAATRSSLQVNGR